MSRRLVVVALALGFATTLVPFAPAAAELAPSLAACPDLARFPGTGLACAQSDGLLRVLSPDGRVLTITHGPDVLRPAPAGPAASRAPTCVSGASGTYYVRVVYARASDDSDAYASMLPTIRAMVNQTNAAYDASAATFGAHADLNVLCTGGLVDVGHYVLPTTIANATFSTIVNDLAAQGVGDLKTKTLVYYDEPLSTAAYSGQGSVIADDRASPSNWNNGDAYAEYAISYGVADAFVFEHELGHNLGAVQLSAPHTSGAYHCIDGLDIMCYNDGGWNARNYTTSSCSVSIFDCGHDDYFHPSPSAASYLGTHWNIASGMDRYLIITGVPVLSAVGCTDARASVGRAETCSFTVTDTNATGASATIDWGDGATTRVPASGTFPANSTQTATHTWASVGSKTVTVSIVDDRTAPGAPRVFTQVVQGAPVMSAFSCSPASGVNGHAVTCSALANDDSASVAYQIDWGDGSSSRVPSTGGVAPGFTQTATHTWSSGGSYTLHANATDIEPVPLTSASLAWTETVRQNVAPTMDAVACAPSSVRQQINATCSLNASDDSTGVFYTIDWGDGTPTTRVPSAGTVAPGASHAASHAWTSPGSYTIQVTATDNDGPLTSAPASATETVVANLAPTMQALSCSPGAPDATQIVTCTLKATDESNVKYALDWGDGAASASGYVASGATVAFTHAYATSATFTLSATATDDAPTPLTSSPMTAPLAVAPDQPPTVDVFGCTSFNVEPGESITCATNATDDSPEVYYLVDYGDGSSTRVPASGYVAPGPFVQFSHAWSDPAAVDLSVIAIDDGGLASSPFTRAITVRNPNAPPVVQTFGCPASVTVGLAFTCTINATDDDTGLRFSIDWGDGSTDTIPSSGYRAVNTTFAVQHTYASAATRVATLSVTDNGRWPTVVTAASTIAALVDATPPSLTIVDPKPSVLYDGCSQTVDTRAGPSIYAQTGCVSVQAADASGMGHVDVFLDGALVGRSTGAGPTYRFAFPVGQPHVGSVVEVRAYDKFGNVAIEAANVDLV